MSEPVKYTLPSAHFTKKAELRAIVEAADVAREQLALMEAYEGLMADAAATTTSSTATAPLKSVTGTYDFPTMRKKPAAAILLYAEGPKGTGTLFNAMKERGHPVANVNSLRTMLSTDPEFERTGDGKWQISEELRDRLEKGGAA